MKKNLKIPPVVTGIIRKLARQDLKAYVVGGVLRDILLGRTPGDFDIATSAKPNQVMKIFKKTVPTGIKHGTVTVIEKGKPYEVTTFRSEWGYSDSRRPDKVAFITDLKKDLSRRDFTINALAYDIEKRLIIDPSGGLRDLKKKLVRTVGNPNERFREDALRIIRAARFAAVLNFKIESRTLKSISRLKSKVKYLSKERVRDEIIKMLKAPKPSIGFKILKNAGILKLILPELTPADGFDQGGLHEYDLLEHSLTAMDKGPKENPLLRLVALLHDVGKTKTRIAEDGDYHFYGHESVGEEMVRQILRRLKFSNKDIEYAGRLTKNHMFNYNKTWKDGAVRRLLNRVGTEYIGDLLTLRFIDAKACGRNRRPSKEIESLRRKILKIIDEDQALKVKDLKVDGLDVMRVLEIGPGKRVGEILRKLLDIVLEDNSQNKRSVLLKEIKKLSLRGT